ncbi:hypothetical protein OAQ84_01155 [Bdellovibrionales bacterium]|nr:hypothetical protein [Bdellovibrionales bacterium]
MDEQRQKSRQDGQMILEAILILVILLGITLFISSRFKSDEIFASIISKPWQSISGMIENGYWEPPAAARGRHPGHLDRHVSLKGEKP